ncbi:MAG: pyruvate kinase [Bdellovibrionales bacterium GWC1_52_8]|nr:MAG: pyruvate kinase [Bdellovibrionales bacterium GWB1_52_6]OFZ03253.1 MAG: pyruvate kinase [Bdellovibrionales bacterium GWA1_52_35]OFZ43775.1 MAG: pyruvate kinase [Bdellovibrionales bacterium GWC1_52_8]HCM40562.1 pyruvate kinase [Bdellovibrionales bacterium]
MLSSFKRRVKIVATLGPSTCSLQQISGLVSDGLDVARLNFSHGSHDFHRELFRNVREAASQADRHVAIMQDLQGPKLRVGKVKAGGLELKAGDHLLLFPEGAEPRSSLQGRIAVPISAEIAHAIAADLEKGARILFDDGRIATRVIEVRAPEVVVEVELGGRLTDHKGMNLPGTPLSMPCLSEKDLADLKFGLEQGADAVALSFVRSVKDIEILRQEIRKVTNNPPLVIAKIEREEAIEEQDAIVAATDGILIARGDMAVEIGPERVPSVQKSLIRACNERGVPVITATQMLESMISAPTPTRAEASDVANAVFDGTDAVMLSGETAAGQYPREALQTMVRIIQNAEHWKGDYSAHREALPIEGSVLDAIEASAAFSAKQVGAVAIACISNSGLAVRTLAKFRPDVPVLAVLDDAAILRKLAFIWGVRGAVIPKLVPTDDLFSVVEKMFITRGWAQLGDLVVVTAGIPTLRRGTTNMMKVHRIGSANGLHHT